MYVCKFGGTSLADADQFRKVADIVRADDRRRYIIVSAPGKRFSGDIKITDMLCECWQLAHRKLDFEPVIKRIEERFREIATQLGITLNLGDEFASIRTVLRTMPHKDYVISRGEYLSAKIMSEYLNRPFIDPADCIYFHSDGTFDAEQTRTDLRAAMEKVPGAVIAGFYGCKRDGGICTFSRGGSDITGALAAEVIGAELYENWTDVSGLLAADPGVVANARTVEFISYRELRVLSYMGASVLHADAVRPCQNSGIPINIRNTNAPDDPGTLIVYALNEKQKKHAVTGVTGRKGLCVVQIEKAMVSDGAGYSALLLDVFKRHRVPFEQCITGIDTISVVVRSDLFAKDRSAILDEIRETLRPDTLNVRDHLSMIAVVGEDTEDSVNATVRVLNAVAETGIRIDTINQGSGNLNLIIGVAEENLADTITAIYRVVEVS